MGSIIENINDLSTKIGDVVIMELCGTHTQSIAKHGIKTIIPKNIKLVSGPGCPVCITPPSEIEYAKQIAEMDDVILCAYGDMANVKVSGSSLIDKKMDGCDVRMVYSISDSAEIAGKNQDKEVVHMAIGFETTAPSTACEISTVPDNFSIINSHRFFPPAMIALLESGDSKINGFICPGHVAAIIGLKPFQDIYDKFNIPQAIAGFNPEQILKSLESILEMIHTKKTNVINQYKEVVLEEGNKIALEKIGEVFKKEDSNWRGLGKIKKSGMKFRREFSDFDAKNRFKPKKFKVLEDKDCKCGEILKGNYSPRDCSLFGIKCNPENPIGSCMVSVEGACHNTYIFER